VNNQITGKRKKNRGRVKTGRGWEGRQKMNLKGGTERDLHRFKCRAKKPKKTKRKKRKKWTRKVNMRDNLNRKGGQPREEKKI